MGSFNRQQCDKPTTPSWASNSRAGPRRRPPLVGLFATKCDLVDSRVVTSAEGEELANQLGCPYFETSKFERRTLDETFVGMAQAYKTHRLCKAKVRRLEEQPPETVERENQAKRNIWKRLISLDQRRI